MTRKTTQGARQISVDIDEKIAELLEDFCKVRKQKKRTVIEQALLRHIANPPPIVDLPPLPPVPVK